MSVKQLPAPTQDVEQAKHDMDEYGFAYVADALSPEQVSAMRDRIVEQAECEAEANGAPVSMDDESLTRVSVGSLLNKGKVWQDLLDVSSPVHQVLEHVFTPSFNGPLGQMMGLEQKFLLSSTGAEFKRRSPGGVEGLHTDQAFVPGLLEFPLVLNVFYMISDFNVENGSTLVVPGSHRVAPPAWGMYPGDGAIATEGPAGTAFIWEGRTWHAIGENTSNEPRIMVDGFYCAPYIRQREALAMNLHQDVVDQLSDEQLKLCGFDTMYQGPAGAHVGFNLIEPTLGRSNVSHSIPLASERHR